MINEFEIANTGNPLTDLLRGMVSLILKKYLLEKGLWKSPSQKPAILNDEINILLL